MPVLNSDQLRVFLAIFRTGSTVSAARQLGIDHSTVSRRLSALEQELGSRLFDRSPRGHAPTQAALALATHAEQVESALIAAAASVAGRDVAAVGTVRLATPEIFGTYLVAPNIADLTARHPGLAIELVPESRSISLSKREADIAVTVRQPPGGRLIQRRLTDYRIGLYASRDYLERHGRIGTVADLAEHPFVSYVDELLDYPELNALGELRITPRIAFRSSSSAAQQAAVAAGVGIGLLHRLAAEQDDRLVPLLPDAIEVVRSYWLVSHADLQRTIRVRAVSAFLADLTARFQGRL